MQLEHRFTVPADIDTVWAAVLDPERVAPCMPGAALTEVDGDAFKGTVKVKLGPISLLYKGSGEFLEQDAAAHRVVIKAAGKDSRGNGAAAATVTLTLTEDGPGSTAGQVSTDLAITGKPAQFGRGLISEVGGKILDAFSTCLAKKLATTEPAPAATPPPTSATGDSAATGSAGSPGSPGTAGPAGTVGSTGTAGPAGTAGSTGSAGSSGSGGSTGSAGSPGEQTSGRGDASPTSGGATAGGGATGGGGSGGASATAGGGAAGGSGTSTAGQDRPLRSVPQEPEEGTEPIDLMEFAGASVAKRLVPVLAGAAVLALVLALRRRR